MFGCWDCVIERGATGPATELNFEYNIIIWVNPLSRPLSEVAEIAVLSRPFSEGAGIVIQIPFERGGTGPATVLICGNKPPYSGGFSLSRPLVTVAGIANGAALSLQ